MRTGAENKGVEWKKMGGWDGYHTLGFEIQLCEFETILCEFETTLCGLEKKKGSRMSYVVSKIIQVESENMHVISK